MEKGQKLYYEIKNYNENIIKEFTIKTIGNKYITVEENPKYKFDKNTKLQVTDYTKIQLYETKQELLNIIEYKERFRYIARMKISFIDKISMEAVNKIYNILKSEETRINGDINDNRSK